ncbi:HEC/Ndc80p family-domain-containing protein [Pilaira anomala]|nr:HEC/Ndc80p family-domain-containing protein [Pilaira anomala]
MASSLLIYLFLYIYMYMYIYRGFLQRNEERRKQLQAKLAATPYERTQIPTKYTPDLKVIKADETQRKFMAGVMDYLKAAKYEDIDRVNIRIINSTQFQSVFKFLIHRILPKRTSKPKFEDEVLDVIKYLEYPVPNSISLSSLRSFSTFRTNPFLLALLYWLTDYCRSGELCREMLRKEQENSSGTLMPFSQYGASCYNTYMSGSDDFSVQNMKLRYSAENVLKEKRALLEETINETDAMIRDIERFSHEKDILRKEHAKHEELLRDVHKYVAYIKYLQEKNEKYGATNQKVKESVKLLQSQRQALIEQINEIKEYWATKNLTIESIDKTLEERSKLDDEIIKVSEKHDEAKREKNMLTGAISRIKDEIEDSVKEYNQNRTKDMLLLQYNREEDEINLDVNNVLPKLIETENDLKVKKSQAIEETKATRTKLNEAEDKEEEEEIEIKELNEILTRKQKSVKSLREAEQKRQNEFNSSKDSLEERRSRILNDSFYKLEDTKSRLEQKKLELIEIEKKIEDDESILTATVADFIAEATRGMEDMTIAGEETKQRLLEKAEEASFKFKEY